MLGMEFYLPKSAVVRAQDSGSQVKIFSYTCWAWEHCPEYVRMNAFSIGLPTDSDKFYVYESL